MQNIILDAPKKRDDAGVSYFNHFRKDFIRTYGLAHSEPPFDLSSLSHRLNNINCEFYLRLQIATSEFAKTIPANLNYIEENLKFLTSNQFLVLFRNSIKLSATSKSWICVFSNSFWFPFLFTIYFSKYLQFPLSTITHQEKYVAERFILEDHWTWKWTFFIFMFFVFSVLHDFIEKT